MNTITFRVNGTPKGQPRPRAFSRGGHARVFDPGTAEGWKGAIALAAHPFRPTTPISGPVKVDAVFYLPRPKRLCGKKCEPQPVPAECKPDKDNLEKALYDALTTIGIWRDDAQIVGGETWKMYHAIGDRPGAVVRIEWGQFAYRHGIDGIA